MVKAPMEPTNKDHVRVSSKVPNKRPQPSKSTPQLPLLDIRTESALTNAERRRKPRTILSLTLGKVGGVIEGRVTCKGDRRHYQRNGKQVFLFNFDVIDDTGCVTVLAVNNEDDSMFEKISVGKAYRISNYKVVPIKETYDTHKRGLQLELLKVKSFNNLVQ